MPGPVPVKGVLNLRRGARCCCWYSFRVAGSFKSVSKVLFLCKQSQGKEKKKQAREENGHTLESCCQEFHPLWTSNPAKCRGSLGWSLIQTARVPDGQRNGACEHHQRTSSDFLLGGNHPGSCAQVGPFSQGDPQRPPSRRGDRGSPWWWCPSCLGSS